MLTLGMTVLSQIVWCFDLGRCHGDASNVGIPLRKVFNVGSLNIPVPESWGSSCQWLWALVAAVASDYLDVHPSYS